MFAAFFAFVLSIQAAEHREHRCCCAWDQPTYLFRIDIGANESGSMARGTLIPLHGVPRHECPHAARSRSRR